MALHMLKEHKLGAGMQVHTRLIDHNRLVFISFTGRQTLVDAQIGLAQMKALPEYRPDLPEICDLSGVTSDNLDFKDMGRLARIANEATLDIAGKKQIALFAPQESVFGMCRMFATLCDITPGKTRCAAFQNPAEALAWLGRTEARFEDIPGFDMVLR